MAPDSPPPAVESPATLASQGANFAREALDRDGYVVIEGVLKPTELRELRRVVAPLLKRTPTGRNRFEGLRCRRVYSLLAKTRGTDALVGNEWILAWCRELLGHHQLSAHIAIEVGAGSADQELHHDDYIYPVPRPHDELVLSALWAIDAMDESSGAQKVFPGSHRWDEGVEPEGKGVPIPLAPGSMLLFRGTLWHGLGENRSVRPVLAIQSEYIASWLRPIETHLLSMSAATARQLDLRLQELVGYNIRPPYTGLVNGRHPRRTLRRLSRIR